MARKLRDYIRPPRKLLFTRDGWWFVTMTVLVGFGAINTGNNLLYLLLGMMLGLVLVSGILSEWVLRDVRVSRLEFGDVFARTPTTARFELTNGKRWMSSFSLSVSEHEARATRARRRVAIGLPESPPARRKDREKEADPGPPRGLALRVPPRGAAIATGTVEFPVRGHYRYVGMDLATRFPFGFFEKIRPIRDPAEVLVYPEIRAGYGALVSDDPRDGELERQVEGRAGEFFGLREYRTGDDLRDVHWKVTARRGQLVRRLYDRRDDEAIAIHVLGWAPPASDPASERAAVGWAEEEIVAAASVCAEITRRGHRFSLHTCDQQVPEGAGPGQLQAALRTLALLQVRRDATPPPLPISANENRLLISSPITPAGIAAQFGTAVAATRRAA
ncbi:MAG: DUF58 domain-containing protein [Myxococcales bacterium]|nr:DUF58 domain-containing protein [Myxococcales bacterium]